MEILTLLWFPSILACIAIAQRKRQSLIGAFLLGVVAGPLGVLIALAVKGDAKCSRCAEVVKREAKVCKHCGSNLAGASA